MNYTENYQLPQWEETDRVLRTDFNNAMSKLDQNLDRLDDPHIAMGSYVGNGKDNRTIQLPWEPQILILFGKIYDSLAITFATPYRSFYISNGCSESEYNVALAGAAIQIQRANWNNESDITFQYIIIR